MRAPRILVVEDEAITAILLQRTLKRRGCEVVAAVATGDEAVAKAITENPDIILMDIRLAGQMDGLEATRLIKEQCDIAVIFTTGYSGEEVKTIAEGLGAEAFLVKPYEEKDLFSHIDRVMARLT